MKNRFVILLVAILSTVQVALAESSPNEVDPYGAPVVMWTGPNKGKVLDTSIRRSLVILKGDAAAIAHPEPGDTVVANFFSEGKFWIAKIPPDAVQDVIVQMEHFPALVPAGHIQGRFILKPGKEIELFPQVGTDEPKTKKLSDITSSNEAVTVPPEKFDVIKGLMKHFGLALRLVNTADRYRDMVTRQHHLVEQFKLNITPEEKQAMLIRTIQLSHESGMKRLYNTILRSCSSVWFHEIMDQSIHYPWNRKLAEVLGMLPTVAKFYLQARGILDAGTVLPDFKTEREGYLTPESSEEAKAAKGNAESTCSPSEKKCMDTFTPTH